MTDRYTIAILEDNAERAARMKSRLQERFPQYAVRIFSKTTAEMIDWLITNRDRVLALSLDHDLELLPGPEGRCIDPGCGRDVATFLATTAPTCDVVIHSTNVPAANAMQQDLEEAGWSVRRITPYGDLEWVDESWFPAIRDAILARAIFPQTTSVTG